MTYVELTTLSLASLEEVLLSFPECKVEIRRAAALMALRRAIELIAGFIRSKRSRMELQSRTEQRRRHAENQIRAVANGTWQPELQRTEGAFSRSRGNRHLKRCSTFCAPPQIAPPASKRSAGWTMDDGIATPSVPILSLKERDSILRSLNGHQLWREVRSDGEIVDEEGNVVTHDYGKDAAGLSGDALHQALVKEITAANKEREDTRKSLAALTQENECADQDCQSLGQTDT